VICRSNVAALNDTLAKRAGSYRLARLAVMYGAEILLDDLLVRLLCGFRAAGTTQRSRGMTVSFFCEEQDKRSHDYYRYPITLDLPYRRSALGDQAQICDHVATKHECIRSSYRPGCARTPREPASNRCSSHRCRDVREAEGHARAAKADADQAIDLLAKQRAELMRFRAKLAEDERRVNGKFTRARGLFELASAPA
jgi:hypothetical protein